jgi:hypothetical protein
MTKAKRPTLIVRGVMRDFGKNWVWTNKHKTMRSVKCYSGGKEKDARLLVAVEKALKKAGYKMLGTNTMKYSDDRGYGPINSFIVRLPL